MLQEGKYYFDNDDNLVKITWVSKSDDYVVVCNYAHNNVQWRLYLPGAEKVLIPAMKIGQVARILDCHPDTIRKWEKRGIIERVKSWEISPGVIWRFYSDKDVRDIRDAASEISRGRPRQDKRVRNKIPSKGSTNRILTEMLRRDSGKA